MPSIYEYTLKSGNFLGNSTVIRIDSENDAIVKLIDKITIDQKQNKYKILLIKTEKDFLKFDNVYGFNPIQKETGLLHEREIKWDIVSKKYGGVALDNNFWTDKLHNKYWHNYQKFGWLDNQWFTNYGFVWRFKIM